MNQRMLRHKTTGIMYVYQDVFAQRPDFEEIIDVEAREIPTPSSVKKLRTKKVETEVDRLEDELSKLTDD